MNVRCPTCDTDQEVSGGASARCVVCGKELGAGGTRPRAAVTLAPSAPPATEAPAATAPAAAKLAAALPAKATSSFDFDELRAGDRAFEWATSLVPLYGLVRLPKAKHRCGARKILAGALSLGSTLALAAGLWAARPVGEPPAALPVEKVRDQIAALHALVLQFREQTGKLPDEATWKRSVETADSQLVDPWGRPYVYERTDRGFRLGSLGRDGAAGGEGENADRFESFGEERS